MIYMVIERYRPGTASTIYERLRVSGRMMPDGLQYRSSWIAHDLSRCWQLMEADDPALFEAWMANWNDLMEFEVIPVLTSGEAATRAQP